MLRYSVSIAKPKEAPMLTVIADAMMVATRQKTEPLPRPRPRATPSAPRVEERYKWRWLGLL